MHMGTRQRKKSIKYSYFKSLHSAMSLSLICSHDIHYNCTHREQQSPGMEQGSSSHTRGQRPARLQQSCCQIPLGSSGPHTTHHTPHCQHLLVCSWKCVLCIRAARVRAEQARSEPSSGDGVGKKEQFAKENNNSSHCHPIPRYRK